MLKSTFSFIFTILLFENFVYAENYRTIWRGYFNLANASMDIPKHLDGRALEFAFIYKSFGIGTKGFRIYNNGTFDGDSLELAGFIAPVYLYWVPFGSHRRTGDITPMVFYSYAGFSAWGFQQGMLIDIGLGFTYYLFSLRFGYNAVRADSRVFLDVEDEGFNDWQINWRSFYFAIDLYPGFWISLKSKLNEKQNQ